LWVFARGRGPGSVRGAGHGIAIAHGFAGANGGRFRLELHGGRELPWSRCRSGPGDLAATGKRILVASDQLQILGTLPAGLRATGYQVEGAAAAETALTVVAPGRRR